MDRSLALGVDCVSSESGQARVQGVAAAGLPCHLETQREANLWIHQNHGSDLVRRVDWPDHAVMAWAMLRKPR